MIKWTSWLKVLSFALFSKRYLLGNKENFDAIIAFDRTLIMDIYRAGNACHREWNRFRKEYGTPCDAVSVRINPLHTVINGIERRIFSSIQQRDGTIVVLSPVGEEQIRRHYRVDRSRFTVVPPIVDVNRFNSERISPLRQEQRRRLHLGDDTVMLLHVGSGFRIKGLQSTIEAASILLKRGSNIALVVVGDDRKGIRRYRRLCTELGIESAVRFTGGVADVERFYAAADLFLLPSLFETFGAAVIEALACGLPVIIGRGAGASRMVEREKVGTVIDTPANPKKFADMINVIAQTERDLKASGKLDEVCTRRTEVASQLDRTRVMSRYLSLIDRIAEERHAVS